MGSSCICRFFRNLDRRGFGVLAGYVLAVSVYATLIVACTQMGGGVWFNLLLVLFGAPLGWTLGILASPKDTREKERFSAYAAGISTFVSGFIAAKVERLYELTIGNELPSELTLSRVMLFSTAFLIGLLCTFIWRCQTSASEPLSTIPPISS